ncbi:MAG TPA: DUF1259 domain-containing protein [Chthoniobacterales bacterium]
MKFDLLRKNTLALSLIAVLCLSGAVKLRGAQDGAAHENSLPQDQIEKIIEAKGEVEDGVLDIGLPRKDIGEVQGPDGVTLTPDFGVSGELLFQSTPDGQAFLNGDIPLREEEVNPFIEALLTHGIIFQAFHQHMPTTPQVWFVHFRGTGAPVELATSIKAALKKTGLAFPLKAPPQNPKSPLDSERLAKILHGEASIGENGVVTIWIKRKDKVTVDGVEANPRANISTNVEFKPIGQGPRAAVIPDFSMKAEQVTPVITLMRTKLGWYQGCLYNQEISETPQLFFDHMVKTGDAYELAKEIRQGLDLTESQ